MTRLHTLVFMINNVRFDIAALYCIFLNWKKFLLVNLLYFIIIISIFLLVAAQNIILIFFIIIIMSILITHQVERLCVRGKQLEKPGERSEPGPVFTQGAKCSCRAGGGGGSAG